MIKEKDKLHSNLVELRHSFLSYIIWYRSYQFLNVDKIEKIEEQM